MYVIFSLEIYILENKSIGKQNIRGFKKTLFSILVTSATDERLG